MRLGTPLGRRTGAQERRRASRGRALTFRCSCARRETSDHPSSPKSFSSSQRLVYERARNARFENVCARSEAHLAITASSAAKVAKTDSPPCQSGAGLRPRGVQLDDLELRYRRQHGELESTVLVRPRISYLTIRSPGPHTERIKSRGRPSVSR
eukprot:5445245-Prymnesium_polylepis.1